MKNPQNAVASSAQGGREGEGIDWPVGVRRGDPGRWHHSSQSPEGKGDAEQGGEFTERRWVGDVDEAGTGRRLAAVAEGPRSPIPSPGASRVPQARRFQSGR